MPRLTVFVLLLALLAAPVQAGSADFDIRLRNNTADERAAKAQLQRLLDAHDVSPYIFTYSVMIDRYGAPHSHPILTVNTVFNQDDASALSTFLHEQFHWFGMVMEPQMQAALTELKELYPTVPTGGNGGARDSYSTYVHLIVGVQELHATASAFGMAEARRVLADKRHYRWINTQVLENTETLTAIARRHGLLLGDEQAR